MPSHASVAVELKTDSGDIANAFGDDGAEARARLRVCTDSGDITVVPAEA